MPEPKKKKPTGFGGLLKRIKNTWKKTEPVVAVVRLSGVIGSSSPLSQAISLSSVASMLEKAFTTRHADAVAICINSPGGSPVQSTLIYKRIRSLAEEHDLPVYVFVEDVAASGGYLLALAGDEIIADESSIVGSIGVIAATFGFDRAIEKLGIDRRVYTAGTKKMTLDPFQPEKADDVRRLKALQKDVHEVFINLVKKRRDTALQGQDKDLFTGEFWSGTRALELGLIDGLGDLRGVLRDRFGEDVTLRIIKKERGFFGLKGGVSKLAGLDQTISMVDPYMAIAAVEERAVWSRYGL